MSGGPESHESGEYISEREDDAAEEAFINLDAIQSEKQRLLSSINEGWDWASHDESFQSEFTAALDDIIDSFSRRAINVREFSKLTEDKKQRVKDVIFRRMDHFTDVLRGEIDRGRDVSDVTDARNKTRDLFKSTEVSEYTSNIEVLRSSENNAKIDAYLDTTGDVIDSLMIDYNDPDGSGFSMYLLSGDKFFKSDEVSEEGTLAARIRANREAYLVPGANYNIEDPKAFDDFITEALVNSGLNLASLTPEQAVTAAADIVKANLQIDASTATAGPSDRISIDQLIMRKEGGCCRHFSVATNVVFEQIQRLSGEAGNENLKELVMFENHMPEMTHGTVAIARGNDVMVIDPTWYAQGRSLNASFSKDHDNVISLFTTLSRHPKGHPELAISDLGHADALLSAVGGEDIPREFESRVLNREQIIHFRVRQMLASGQLNISGNMNNENFVERSNNLNLSIEHMEELLVNTRAIIGVDELKDFSGLIGNLLGGINLNDFEGSNNIVDFDDGRTVGVAEYMLEQKSRLQLLYSLANRRLEEIQDTTRFERHDVDMSFLNEDLSVDVKRDLALKALRTVGGDCIENINALDKTTSGVNVNTRMGGIGNDEWQTKTDNSIESFFTVLGGSGFSNDPEVLSLVSRIVVHLAERRRDKVDRIRASSASPFQNNPEGHLFVQSLDLFLNKASPYLGHDVVAGL